MSTNALELKQKKGKKGGVYSSKVYNRCHLCGRARGYMREFDMCRICFRKLAHEGKIPGVIKSSW
jgi:small subunit ribosomal protein S14